MNRFILFVTLLCILSANEKTYAQMPEMALAPNQIDGFVLNTRGNQSSFVVRNKLMRDIIILQNQINLLDGLVERQSEVDDIAYNYEKIGVPFKQPAPPQSTCEKLPLNVLCLFFYPNLPVNQTIVSESLERFKEKQKQEVELKIVELQERAIERAKSIKNQGKSLITSSNTEAMYYWSDMQCVSGKCSAVIESSTDRNDKVRVNAGYVHINGMEISHINPEEAVVTAIFDGKKINIEPLSKNNKIKSSQLDNLSLDAYDEDEIVDILSENLAGKLNVSAPAPSISNIFSTSGSDVDNKEETIPVIDIPLPDTLGPTGLF